MVEGTPLNAKVQSQQFSSFLFLTLDGRKFSQPVGMMKENSPFHVMFHESFHILHSPKLTVRSCQEAILTKGNLSKPTTVFQVRAVCFREGSHMNWCPPDF